MTNIITQKHSFDNDEKYEHKKEFSFWKTLIFGASVHEGFPQNISKTGFKHIFMLSLVFLYTLLFFFEHFIELFYISSDYGINNCPNHQVSNNKNAGKS